MNRSLLAALALSVLGCQYIPKNDAAENIIRSPALVRGKVTANVGYGLALLLEKPNRDVCTGVFVQADNRRTFLTAGHCLREFREGDTLRIARTVIENGEPKLKVIARVKAKQAHPDYKYDRRNEISAYDIAVGIADVDFPKDMKPLALVEPDWLPGPGTIPYTFVGAGLIDDNLGATPREITAKSTAYLENDVQVRAGEYHSEVRIERQSSMRQLGDYVSKAELQPGDQLTMSARDERDPYICVGDSGGPLVETRDNGEKRVAGVFASAGFKEASGSYYCWWYPFSAIPVSPHLAWIKSAVKQLQR